MMASGAYFLLACSPKRELLCLVSSVRKGSVQAQRDFSNSLSRKRAAYTLWGTSASLGLRCLLRRSGHHLPEAGTVACLPSIQSWCVLSALEHQLSLALHLPDPLARDLQVVPLQSQCRRFALVEAVAAHQDVPVALGKPSYSLPKPGLLCFSYDLAGGIGGAPVLYEAP